MNPLFEADFQACLSSRRPFVCVTLVDAIGSAPQDPGAKMLVDSSGLRSGTVGGGKVEARCLAEAQLLLDTQHERSAPQRTRFFEWQLNRDIGMTCGGSVKIFFECYGGDFWPIVVFGAGHVANALIPLLLQLPCQVTCVDSRPEWLARLPEHPVLQKVCLAEPAAFVDQLDSRSFVVMMTMGHGTDKPILLKVLASGLLFPYIGVIGSRAKALRLKQDVQEAGLPEADQNRFFCPIGLDVGSNHPQEIAISIAAQLLQVRDCPVTQH